MFVPPYSASRRFLLPTLCLLAAMGIFSTSLYLPSLPAVGRDLGASVEEVQFTLVLFFLGSAAGSLVLGPLADRFGRLSVAKGGLILFIVTSFWCATSQTIESLQLARLIQGIAASSGPLVARAMGRDLYEGANLTRYSATIAMVISVSPAIAPIIGGTIEVYLGWEKNFYFLMIFGLVLAYLVWKKLPETSSPQATSLKAQTLIKNYIFLLKDTSFSLTCLVLGLQMLAVFCYVAISPYLFISFYHWSPQEYGFIGITSAFGNIVGFAISRRLAHRLHFHTAIFVGSFLCFVTSLTLVGAYFFFPIDAFAVIIFSILFYGFSALAIVNAATAAMNIHPQMAGASSAMVGAIQIGSGAIGSALASFLPISPLALGLTLGILSLVCVGLGSFIKRKTWLGR